eukprot:Rhum_TRINITY_DN18749_c0_g1::Rhum_TRINITY_DN18749_c0_g1_i1::g.168328::m.168328
MRVPTCKQGGVPCYRRVCEQKSVMQKKTYSKAQKTTRVSADSLSFVCSYKSRSDRDERWKRTPVSKSIGCRKVVLTSLQDKLAELPLQHKLLDFPCCCERKVVKNVKTTGNLEVRDLPLRKALQLIEGEPRRRLFQNNAGANLLAHHRMRESDDSNIQDFGVLVQEGLNLSRVDVLSPSDDHVLLAANNPAVPVFVEFGNVSGVHETVAVDAFARRGLHAVVAARHHAVALRAQLAWLAALQRVTVVVNDLHLRVRMHHTHRLALQLLVAVDRALEACRRRLRHAVNNGNLTHVQALHDVGHDLRWTLRPCHHPGPESLQPIRGREVVQLRQNLDEHGGHAVKRCAAVSLNRFNHLLLIEGNSWEHHRDAVCDCSHRAEDRAKAVVERNRDAHRVLAFPVLHAIADEKSVVQDVVVGQGGGLWVACGATRVLDICQVMWRDRPVVLRHPLSHIRRHVRLRERRFLEGNFAGAVDDRCACASSLSDSEHVLKRRHVLGKVNPRQD